MSYRNPELHKALKAYVQAAIQKLQKEVESLRIFDFELPIARFVFRRQELEQMPEYRECFDAFKKDLTIFNQLNKMVGVAMSGSRSLPLETLMLHLPQLLGVYDEVFEFNELYFEREYKEFEETYYSSEIKYEVIVPLQGSRFKEPIKLGDNLEICAISPKDLRPPLIEDKEMENDKESYGLAHEKLWVIRTSYKLPKIVEDDRNDSKQHKEDDKKRESANDVIEQVITALRIFCTAVYGYSNVYPAAILHRSAPYLFPNNKPFPVRYVPERRFTTNFDKGFTAPFQKFWRMFQAKAVVQRRFITVAARRFSFAHERHHWEDKIIDLLIAAEAIFLCDQGEKIELSYRLSLRASFFLGTNIESRKQIFKDFKTAYNLRSSVVHGSTVEKLSAKIAKEEYGLEGFV